MRRLVATSIAVVVASDATCFAHRHELYKRQWVEAKDMGRRPGQPLRVVQFNLLADGLSGMHKEKGGFTESPEGSLDW